MSYDHWKTTNPADAFLGPEPEAEERDPVAERITVVMAAIENARQVLMLANNHEMPAFALAKIAANELLKVIDTKDAYDRVVKP